MECLVCGGERCCSHKCHISDGLWCRMRIAFVSLSAITLSDPSHFNRQVVRAWDEGFANDRCSVCLYHLHTASDSCQVHSGLHAASAIFFQSSFTCYWSSACFPIMVSFFFFIESQIVTFCVKSISRVFVPHTDTSKFSLQTTCWAICLATVHNGAISVEEYWCMLQSR